MLESVPPKIIIAGAAGAIVWSVALLRQWRLRVRAKRLERRALAEGLRFEPGPRSVTGRWPFVCFLMAPSAAACHVIEGTRSGRTFTSFDYQTSRLGITSHAFTAAVVECPIPEGARTAVHKSGFAPWRLEFSRSAVIALNDDFVDAAEIFAVIDEVNAVLDVIVRKPVDPPPPSQAAA